MKDSKYSFYHCSKDICGEIYRYRYIYRQIQRDRENACFVFLEYGQNGCVGIDF